MQRSPRVRTHVDVLPVDFLYEEWNMTEGSITRLVRAERLISLPRGSRLAAIIESPLCRWRDGVGKLDIVLFPYSVLFILLFFPTQNKAIERQN